MINQKRYRYTLWGWCILLVVGVRIGYGQNFEEEIEQLTQQLSQSSDPQDQVDLMNQISFSYRRISHDKMREYALRANQLALEIDYPKGLAISFKNIGNSHLKQRTHPDTTRYFYQKSIEIAEEIEDYYTVAACLNNIALAYEYSGRNGQAISFFLKGLDVMEEHVPDPDRQALKYRMLGNLGTIYYRDKNWEKGAYYLQQCIQQAEENNNKVILASYLDDLALVNAEMGDFEQAESYFQQALGLQDELADYQSQIHTLHAYQQIMVKRKDYEKAESLLEQSLQLSEEKGFLRLVCISKMYLGELYFERKEYKRAIEACTESLRISRQGVGKDYQLELFQTLHQSHARLQDSARAYHYLIQYSQISDSLNRSKEVQLAAEIEAKYSVKQRQQEIETLGMEKAQQQSRFKLLLVFAGILFLFLLIYFFLLKSKTEQSELLATRNRELEKVREELKQSNEQLQTYIDSNLQLENFAYMASHDLRAPLVNISAFSKRILETSQSKLEPTEWKLLQFVEKNARNMEALIYSLLEYAKVNTEKLHPIPLIPQHILQETLNEVSTYLQQKQANVSLESGLSEQIMADEVKFKQIFQNLLLNAVKFCPEGRTPQIRITGEEFPTHWQFSVEDNGIGIGKDHLQQVFLIFRRLHSRDKYEGSGIGLASVKRLVEQHKGKIWVESTVNVGSTFYFTIGKDLEEES